VIQGACDRVVGQRVLVCASVCKCVCACACELFFECTRVCEFVSVWLTGFDRVWACVIVRVYIKLICVCIKLV